MTAEKANLFQISTGSDRNTVYMNGLAILAGMLFLYTITQFFGLFYVAKMQIINRSVYIFSMFMNAALGSFLLYSFFQFRKCIRENPDQPNVYRWMIASTAALFVVSLGHIHIMGSQNSLHHLLIVAVLLVVSWFFHWREVFLYFFFGNLGLALVVWLEIKGYISYAPLFLQHQKLAEIFLDWRVVVGQSINYIFVLVASTILVWKLRQVLETSERKRMASNKALQEEVTVRIQSEKEKEELIQKLQATLDDVKTLRGLLPICTNCKKIRDDQGYWQHVESYFKQHSPEIEFTHSLCPKCAAELYPDEWESISKE